MADQLTLEPGVDWFVKIPCDQFTLKDGTEAPPQGLLTKIGEKFLVMIKARHPGFTGKMRFDTVVRGKNNKMSGVSQVQAYNGSTGKLLKKFPVLDEVSTTCMISFWFAINTTDLAAETVVQMTLHKVKTYKIIKGEDPGRFKGGGATVWHVYSDDEDDLEDPDTDAGVEKLTAAEAEMPAANEPESRSATSPALTTTPAAEESAAGPAEAIATEDKALVHGTPVKKGPVEQKRAGAPLSKAAKKARGKGKA